MTRADDVKAALQKNPKNWLVTGAAGFIGSHLVETLLGLGQRVIGIDDLSTGKRENIEMAAKGHPLFTFHEGDVCDRGLVDVAIAGVDVVLHQAALGSVPRSLKNPMATHKANVDGFVTVLDAAREAQVKKFVYASSSSVYGDHPDLPKKEETIGQPLSPYAATKRINEVYAAVFQHSYGLDCTGLRYFNVFGPRQDKDGAYAAVIPVWVGRLLRGDACVINGDGETSRDFCYVDNAVQANLLAAVQPSTTHEVFNVACGARTDLAGLFTLIRDGLVRRHHPELAAVKPTLAAFRPGDVRHSLANIDKAARVLGYEPSHTVAQGIEQALDWYVEQA